MKPTQFLNSYAAQMENPEFCFGIDNNQNPAEEWNTAKLRILIPFLSPGPTRAVSGTYTVLNNIIKNSFGSDVFVDNCYLPSVADIQLFKRHGMPFLFGNVSHEFWHEYDLISFSLSILPEKVHLVERYNRSNCQGISA